MFSLALYGAIAVIALGFWALILGSFVLDRPVFENLLEDESDRK